MQLLTYDDALTELCDHFDTLIAPKKLRRSNTNVIYLLLKAFAKGWEVMHAAVHVLYGKFLPQLCSSEDLESLGFITGTRKLGGAASGLLVTVINNSPMDAVLAAGTYTFAPDANMTFAAVLDSDITVPAEGSAKFTMMSASVGSYHYTGMTDIKVESSNFINESLTFSCSDNTALLGYDDESDLDFRRRILEDTDRQDIITELRDAIRSLPYVFDCNIKFNNTAVPVMYDGYTIEPYRMLLMVSGEMRSEIAEVVAKKGIYPTVQAPESVAITYRNDIFFNGYTVYATPFRKTDFLIQVTYSADATYITENQAEQQIRTALFSVYTGNVHFDVLTENDVFTVLLAANITGVRILGVVLGLGDGDGKEYLRFDTTRIPNLKSVTCVSVDLSEQ